MTAHVLEPTDLTAATDTLAAAFTDYPLFQTLAVPARRPAACAAFCRMLAAYSVRLGHAYATADRTAVACWLPPTHPHLRFFGLVRSGVVSLARRLGVRGTLRVERLGRAFAADHARHAPGPHWYLTLLGTRPDRQGKGLSRVVLRPVFEAADHDRRPCYLETQDEANVVLYRRLGFEVAGASEPFPGLRNWGMIREPA